MILKPVELEIVEIEKTRINDYDISTLAIDLKHINYGLTKSKEYRKKKRSSFIVGDVVDFFQSLDGIELEVDSDDLYDYFVVERNYFSDLKRYRIVFCIEKMKPTTSGIITLFEVAKEM